MTLTVYVDARAGRTQDGISVLCWADGTPLERALQRVRWSRFRAAASPVPVLPVGGPWIEVWYGGCRVARCDVPRSGSRGLRIGHHAGPHLSPAHFSARWCASKLGAARVRVAVIVAARAATEVEALAGALLPPLEASDVPAPPVAELVELRRALMV